MVAQISLRMDPRCLRDFNLNRRFICSWRRVSFEDKAPASLVVRGVGPEEVHPHLLQFLGAIARKWFGAFVVYSPLMLPPKIQTVFRLSSEARCSFPQFPDEGPGILSKRVVEKSNLQSRLRSNRLARLDQL
jgi:hypothetical protein